MTSNTDFEIFLATLPGLEPVLWAEVKSKGFRRPKEVPGGVVITGGWPEVWRANLWVRGAGRVLARVDAFHVLHLAQLEGRARRVPWASVLRPDVPFRVEASCAKSRIYHSGAAAERIAAAIAETLGAPPAEGAAPGEAVTVRARIEHDLCTISVDTSGELLHKRGYKEAVNRAPMRETMASLFLRQCGYEGAEPVLDPMCGSGTFVIEAAEIAARLNPGRARSFAFEKLASFDAAAWQQMRAVKSQRVPAARFYGSDRDAGAVAMSRANAARAGVSDCTEFRQNTISDLLPPAGPPGLVIANPPYGARIGERKALAPLYRALGQVLMGRFGGWRVGIITSEPGLAAATGLPFLPATAPVPHGGLRVSLFRTAPLA
ncbi:THUMP domain-containing class I SAM-dependent RNA methyltransferase [Teichococcus oryzae]|uniref:Class I SAM-dependent RNA methyltransferase n=1 Tax=Teichococcus oryzae TaxID=1608942 RepID=A0A5B2TGI4_9PROT|nr:class I SAM-dependent RNA methyltransferase [Pseudoroseomonas oryzae]KAA2213213.1 class I SAM-dependent RNA methyltransferase [Pseudoroseomonas oryzae]